jgi:hypothetical protein
VTPKKKMLALVGALAVLVEAPASVAAGDDDPDPRMHGAVVVR